MKSADGAVQPPQARRYAGAGIIFDCTTERTFYTPDTQRENPMPQTHKHKAADDTTLFASLWAASEAGRNFYWLARQTVPQSRLKQLLRELESLHRQVLHISRAQIARTSSPQTQTCRWSRLGYRHAESVLQAPTEELLATLIALENRQKQAQLRALAAIKNQPDKHALSAQTAWLQMLIDRLKQYRTLHVA
jgi:hypothetical protein